MNAMMYPFLTLDDNTEITHSEMKADGSVKVYIEKPDQKDCFHYATCWLPEYKWEDVYGFNEKEMKRYVDIVKSTAHQIAKSSKQFHIAEKSNNPNKKSKQHPPK